MTTLMRFRLNAPVVLVIAAMLLAISAPVALAGKASKNLKRGIAAGNKALVIKALEGLSAENSEKAAKTILGFALNVDALCKSFDPKEVNEIFDEAKTALARMRNDKALRYVFKSLKSHKRYEVRVVVAEVCGVKDDPEAETALVDALTDKHPIVAGVAARILGARAKWHDIGTGMDRLIDLLEKVETHRRAPWLDVIQALVSLTGESMDVAADWRNWWNGVRDTFQPREARRRKKDLSGTVLREAPKLFGQEILSKRVVFVLDVSGSMALKDPVHEGRGKRPKAVHPEDAEYPNVPEERMRMYRLKHAMIEALKGLPNDTKLTILTFATGVNHWNQKLVTATAKTKAEAIEFTKGMSPLGFTWTDAALEEAFKIPEANAFYLFSDGIPQRGKDANGGPDYIDREEILEKVRQWNRTRKVKLYTIGFGEADATFMMKLAQENGGKFTAVR
ncbi:hypothetical protein ACFL59_15145 [Planctomycetota bacterium]